MPTSPRPRPARNQSVIVSCPGPHLRLGTLHVRQQSLAANSPQMRIDDGKPVSAFSPRLILDFDSSKTEPSPGMVHVHQQSTAAVKPQTWLVRNETEAVVTPRPVREHDARKPVRWWVGGGRVNLLLAPSPFCAPN